MGWWSRYAGKTLFCAESDPGHSCLAGAVPVRKEGPGAAGDSRISLVSGGGSRLFRAFNLLLWKYPPYRNQVVFRCAAGSRLWGYALRLLYPPKRDLEVGGEIGEGLVVYHGHGTVIAAHSIGKDFQIYQGATVGNNRKPGQERHNPIIGDNVTVYTNAVVAGNITIGDNVEIGAGAVVMKDVPSNSVVIGNPCVIRQLVK